MWASTRSSALRLAAAVALGAMIAASPARGADASKAPPLPAPVTELAPDARIQGAGAFRFLGMSIYDGFYWSAVRGYSIAAPFAQAFFGIWLDPRTSRPDFRSRLLGES